ncbi:MAG: 16S rRNA (cytosine(1402)-N(4))-methyltransferase RsmH [Atribacterota bacterium]
MIDYHIPVMCSQVLTNLITKKDGIYVDCTLGGGGHSREIIKKIHPEGLLVGLDQDIEALEYTREKLKDYQDKIFLIKSNFGDLEKALRDLGLKKVTGVLFDLGLSSRQISAQSRGFSFLENHLLDMRMDLSKQLDASYIINHYSEEELWEIFSKYGEERFSRSIARLIVQKRKNKPIQTTRHLAELIISIYKKYKKNKWRIHPATRVFQALRIEVNNELERLKEALKQAINLLEWQGRICVISYHSLEDRIVKHTFKELASKESATLYGYRLKIISKKPFYPSEKEIKENRRARSAKMRVAEKNTFRESNQK